MQRVQAYVKAVDNVSFHIYEGESLGLVGESGCGKTTVGRTILRLVPATSGKVIFNGQDIFEMNAGQLKKLRRDMQIIFQDPYSSLDPRLPVGESIAEVLRIHTDKKSQEWYDVVVEMLSRVGMRAIPVPDPTLTRQRVILQGDVPSPINPPQGCRFHTRCPLAFDKCSQEDPPFKDYGTEHYAACWLLETGEKGARKLTLDKISRENISVIG